MRPDAHDRIRARTRRLEQFCDARARFLEATAPFTRALTAQALLGPVADQAIRVSRNAQRRQHQEVERLFGREFAKLPRAEQTEIVEALLCASSPSQCEYLRRSRGNSAARARAVMSRTLKSILRDAGVKA